MSPFPIDMSGSFNGRGVETLVLPEPAALPILAAIGGLAFAARARRRRSR